MNKAMLHSFMDILRGPCMAREGEAVLACCSGGVDSMVLLDLLVKAAGPLRLRLGVVHVDHGIRQEASALDALFVSAHCERLGLPCYVYGLGMSPDAPNLEEQARKLRYEKIFSCMDEHVFQSAATGHTRDDQAETLLYRLIRGSGIRGLAGMEFRSESGLIRPLLSFTKPEIQAYARENAVPFVEDSTNKDLTLARNLIRTRIIPAMKRINPSVVRSISSFADIAREEGELIEGLSQKLEEDSRVLDWGIVRAFRLPLLEAAPQAVLKRMVIRIASAMLDEPRGIDRIQVEGVMDVVQGRKAGHTIRRRVTIRTDDGCLVFCRAGAGPYYEMPVEGPGTYTPEPLLQQVRIDFRTGATALRLTSARRGERFQGRRVVKLLADKGVMKSLRPFWPVILSNDEVVSIAGIVDSTEVPGLGTGFP